MKKMILIVVTLFTTSLFASDGATLFNKCNSCHGQFGEKKALGKSKVIAKWDAQRIEDALRGYKEGTYGGALKATMKAQASKLSDAQIKTLAAYIDSLM